MIDHIEEKINQILLLCKRPVNSILAGEYHSTFKGRGIDFSELREYQYGDDVRLVDWNVTARMRKTFVRLYKEERDLTLYFIVDFSASTLFSSTNKSKREIISEICSLIALAANKNNDNVGLIIFTDEVEHYITPAKGKKHIMRIIDDLLTYQPKSKGTNISNALQFFSSVSKKSSIVFLLSDFIGDNFASDLAISSHKHDLIAVSIYDNVERKFPQLNIINMVDLETNKKLSADMNHKQVESFNKLNKERHDKNLEYFRSHNVDLLEISTKDDHIQKIIDFFKANMRSILSETGG
jgi:uncharacterized protein (DUF58 family)